VEDEIVITRDSRPVARLVRIAATTEKRRRWDAAAHARWQKKVGGGKLTSSDALLAASRADRTWTGKGK
jgi:antitoxin (DNA-binding transcriptional repressor) of toxin-antitoxin stability system